MQFSNAKVALGESILLEDVSGVLHETENGWQGRFERNISGRVDSGYLEFRSGRKKFWLILEDGQKLEFTRSNNIDVMNETATFFLTGTGRKL